MSEISIVMPPNTYQYLSIPIKLWHQSLLSNLLSSRSTINYQLSYHRRTIPMSWVVTCALMKETFDYQSGSWTLASWLLIWIMKLIAWSSTRQAWSLPSGEQASVELDDKPAHRSHALTHTRTHTLTNSQTWLDVVSLSPSSSFDRPGSLIFSVWFSCVCQWSSNSLSDRVSTDQSNGSKGKQVTSHTARRREAEDRELKTCAALPLLARLILALLPTSILVVSSTNHTRWYWCHCATAEIPHPCLIEETSRVELEYPDTLMILMMTRSWVPSRPPLHLFVTFVLLYCYNIDFIN